MKRTIYYFSPLIIIPGIFLAVTLLESMKILKSITPFFLFAALFLFSALFGMLSPAKARFDLVITAFVPISMFLALFIFLFFDEGCDGTPQLSLHHALNMEYYKVWLPIALIMTVITFIFSFKPIRNFVTSKFSFMKKSTYIILPFSILANAVFLSLGIECFLNLLALAMAISLDGSSAAEQYPRFIPFCVILGFVALIGVACMLFFNIRISEKLKFTKLVWYVQYISAFVLSIPMIKLWEILFDILEKNV